MSKNDYPYLFCVFPYLKTVRRLLLRGIEFRSNLDLEDIEAGPRENLTKLCAMFFLGDGVQIREMTCACIRTDGDESEAREGLRRVYEVQLLVGYLYSSPQPMGGVFLSSESSSLFVFRPDRVPALLVWHEPGEGAAVTLLRDPKESETGFLEGYEGRRNDTAYLWVAEGSRIFPEIPHQVLNLSQYLSENLLEFLGRDPNWAFRRLYLEEAYQQKAGEVRDRVFAGLEWYMRSCRASISESEALVHLAIALESLLKVPNGERLTERFKDAVLTLIGPVPRLDSWLDQFYTARSKAVHEGVPHELMFFATDRDPSRKSRRSDESSIPHRPLIEYGRRIFRLCLTNLVSAAENADLVALDKLFVHNSERLQTILKTLNQRDKSPNDRLGDIEPLVDELHEYQGILAEPFVTVDAVLSTARLLCGVFVESGPTLSDEAKAALEMFQGDACKKAKKSEQLAAMKAAAQALRGIGGTRRGHHDVVTRFLDYAGGHAFQLRTWFEERQ